MAASGDPSGLPLTSCSRDVHKDLVVIKGGAILSANFQLVARVSDNEPFSFQGLNILPRVLDDGRVLHLTTTVAESDFTQQAKRKKVDIDNEVLARKQDMAMSMEQMTNLQEQLVRDGGDCDSDEVEEDVGLEIARIAATVKKHRREIKRLNGLESVNLRYSVGSSTRSLRLEAGRMTLVPCEFFASPLVASSSAAMSASAAGCSGSDSQSVLWVWTPVQPSAAELAQMQTSKDKREVSEDVPLLRLQQVAGVELKYVPHSDENGLFHYLGTAHGTAAWRNPVESGAVTVTSSHPFHEDGPVSDLFSKNDNCFMHETIDHQWICVDLGAGTTIANVTHCSLDSEISFDRGHSLKLEGSLDGSTWELLKVLDVQDDESLCDDSVIDFTWRLPGTSAPARFLRITHLRDDDGEDYLDVGSLELHGIVTVQ